MSPRVYNRHRRILWDAQTGAVEWWLSFGLLCYAAYLIWPDTEPLPWLVTWLTPAWVTEPLLGWGLALLAGLQWWHADTRQNAVRYLAAAALWVALGYGLLLYWEAGEIGRRIVPLMAAAWVTEFWIAWRAWHDRRTVRLILRQERTPL